MNLLNFFRTIIFRPPPPTKMKKIMSKYKKIKHAALKNPPLRLNKSPMNGGYLLAKTWFKNYLPLKIFQSNGGMLWMMSSPQSQHYEWDSVTVIGILAQRNIFKNELSKSNEGAVLRNRGATFSYLEGRTGHWPVDRLSSTPLALGAINLKRRMRFHREEYFRQKNE